MQFVVFALRPVEVHEFNSLLMLVAAKVVAASLFSSNPKKLQFIVKKLQFVISALRSDEAPVLN